MSYAMNGFGAYYAPNCGYGAVEGGLDATAAWADAQTWDQVQAEKKRLGCDAAPGQPACAQLDAKANAASRRVAIAVQEALNAAGYGPLAVDGVWGPATDSAWKRFTADEGLPSGPGLVNEAGLRALEARTSRAGLGALGWGLLLVAGAAVAYGMVKGKRRRRPATGRAMMRTR